MNLDVFKRVAHDLRRIHSPVAEEMDAAIKEIEKIIPEGYHLAEKGESCGPRILFIPYAIGGDLMIPVADGDIVCVLRKESTP